MTTTTGVTVEAFLAGGFPRGAELLHGEVVVTDPTLYHQELAQRLIEALRALARLPGGRGRAGFGGNWTVEPGVVVKPDVWWVADPDRIDLHAARNDGPPDLVGEVRSPGTWHVDVGGKREMYERVGVRELWLVDTASRSVLVYRRSRPDAPGFDRAEEVDDGALTTPLLPGFALPLPALFDV